MDAIAKAYNENESVTVLNDTVTGAAGDDTVKGGTGRDTAVYAGDLANFTVVQVGDTIVITDATGAEGIDTVSSVELFVFAGESFTLAELLGPPTDFVSGPALEFGQQYQIA